MLRRDCAAPERVADEQRQRLGHADHADPRVRRVGLLDVPQRDQRRRQAIPERQDEVPADERQERALVADETDVRPSTLAESGARIARRLRMVRDVDLAREVVAEDAGHGEPEEHQLVVHREAEDSEDLADDRHGDRGRQAHDAPAHREQVVAAARSGHAVHEDVEGDGPDRRRDRDDAPQDQDDHHRDVRPATMATAIAVAA